MKRLLLFVLLATAAWYGWKHHDELRRHGSHEIVAMNNTGRALERVRIKVAGQSFAIESLEPGATTELGLRSEQDGAFDVVWNVRGIDGEKHWTGGGFYHGPVLMRHRLEFVDGDGVVWSNERITTATTRPR